MRLLLFILVILAAGVWVKKPAEAQNGGWCAYLNGGGHDGGRECGFATLQQCLAEVRGVGGNCGPSPYYQPPYQQRPHYQRYRSY